jgi:hypothetical protein
LTSNWGLSTWRLLLGRKGIVGWPYKWTEAFRLGLLLDTGIGRDPGAFLLATDSHQFSAAMKGRKIRIYAVAEIQSITLACSAWRNRIENLMTKSSAIFSPTMIRSKGRKSPITVL